ncbi:hypothetical protein SAMN04487988_11257 [Algoriphagus hitonicola]|uniref:6-bladed beta-propeller protein n=1 Tax=Algoriphagus hitonicola TaxID=435880 RepID=A0A1I2WBV5_9BACT|nr:6-bladed beta-propeller [Algoriphagus hitonicola]SFG98835.1 hypothetical protein SAMN04487988_11257 [Algoriphagus hitonicola]
MRGFLLFIVFLVTGFACQSNSEKTGDIQVKEIFIDLDQPVNFKASQFFDTCFIVPLDNRELIGEVSELFLDENHMLITDKRSTQKIYLYDWEGSLIQFLGTEGEGPGEYKFQRNIQLLSKDEFVLYSSATNKLVYQKFSEQLGQDLNLDTLGPLKDFKLLNGNYYFARENESKTTNQILVFDSDFELLEEIKLDEKFLSQDQSKYGMGKENYFFPKWDGKGFYFSDVENPHFLDFENDLLKTIYRVRLSEREIDYSKISTGSDQGRLNLARSQNLTYFANAVQVHPDFLFIGYGDGPISKMAIWDKKSDIAYPVEKIENDFAVLPNINSIGMSAGLTAQPGFYIFMLEAPMLIDVLERIDEKDNVYLKKLRALNIQKDDNPILFIYRFKQSVNLKWP